MKGIGILKGILRISNHRAPNNQLTIEVSMAKTHTQPSSSISLLYLQTSRSSRLPVKPIYQATIDSIAGEPNFIGNWKMKARHGMLGQYLLS